MEFVLLLLHYITICGIFKVNSAHFVSKIVSYYPGEFMEIPKLTNCNEKSRWNHSDIFGMGKNEYIKSFVHNQYSIGYHTHSFYELNIVINGDGYHYIEHMACKATRGNVFLIPPAVKHGYTNCKNLDVYHMLIHRDFIQNCFSEFLNTEGYNLLFDTEPYLRAHYHENMFLTLSEKELEEIRIDIGHIDECLGLSDADLYINVFAKKILCRLCVLIAKQYDVLKKGSQSMPSLVSIAECLNYIHRNYEEKLTIENLSHKFNMSRSTFIRRFQKACGCSPHHYIHRFRIKKAEEYLNSTDMGAGYVAQECGFYDISHMRKYINNHQK